MLKSESSGGQIANFSRTVVLDSTRVGEAGLNSPLFTVCFEELERLAIEFNESLADNRLVFAVSSFHVHHLGDRHTTGDPLFSRLRDVGYLGKVTGETVLDQHESVETEGVAVISIEIGRESATAFVTEEVVLCTELALVCAGFFSLSELSLNHFGEELFGLDEGNLNVTVRVTLEEELLLDALRENIEYLEGFSGKTGLDEIILRVPVRKSIELCRVFACEQLVDLSDPTASAM